MIERGASVDVSIAVGELGRDRVHVHRRCDGSYDGVVYVGRRENAAALVQAVIGGLAVEAQIVTAGKGA